MLIALLAWALRPYYKMGHFRPRKGDLLRRGSVLIAGLLCLIPIAHPQILGMFGVETDVCVPDRRCRCRISAKHRIYGSGKTG